MNLIEKAFSASDFRRHGHELINLLADHLENVSDEKVLPWQEPADALAYWQTDFAKALTDNPTEIFADIVAKSVKLHHPHYMGHQVTPPVPLAALSGVLTGLINNGMAVYEMGMVSNPLERIITDLIAQQMGHDSQSGGFLTSGGTLANLTALLAARAVKVPDDVWELGNQDRKLAVMVSEEAHYCVDRAVRVMGLGDLGIIKIPVNDRYQMRTELLESLLENAQSQNIEVFCVVASACSTSTGAYDDIEATADFCQKHNIWLHVDGAHGGAVVFSDKYKHLVNGLNRADSTIIDLHKMMMMPALATAVIFKNGNDGFQTFHQKAQYLWDNPESYDWFNSGKRTFECTKLMMSVKIYVTLRTYGVQLLSDNVDILHDLAANFAQLIQQSQQFELAVWPQSNIVCFRYLGKIGQNLNELNAQMRKQILNDGEFYIVQTLLNGQTYLRVSLMNPLTKIQDLVFLLENIKNVAK
jgi:L-2,4-diaminobutyrate decarboxylase